MIFTIFNPPKPKCQDFCCQKPKFHDFCYQKLKFHDFCCQKSKFQDFCCHYGYPMGPMGYSQIATPWAPWDIAIQLPSKSLNIKKQATQKIIYLICFLDLGIDSGIASGIKCLSGFYRPYV